MKIVNYFPPRKIVNYQTAEGRSITELDKAVMRFIEAGFQPWGSPYMSDQPAKDGSDAFYVYQAMVSYQDEEV